MQDNSPLPPQHQTLLLSEFLAALIQSFEKEGLRPCILRNYEGFPNSNVGSDIDFLIGRSDLPLVIRALQALPGIQIVGYAERHYVAHLFVEGVSPAPGIRALELDFIWSLNWKGLEYLRTKDVLQAAIQRRAGDLTFLVPSPPHEAIISLLSSLLIGGWLKEKYFPKVQQTFAGNSLNVIEVLSPPFGKNAAALLVGSVIGGNRHKILSRIRPLRISLLWRCLLRRPLRSTLSAVQYYAREFAVRCTPSTLETVYLSDSDTRDKESVIENLMPRLRNVAKIVERRELGPRLSESKGIGVIAAPDEENRNSKTVSIAVIFKCLAKEWISQFTKKDNLTLRIGESCCCDLLVDSQRRGTRIPAWLARMVTSLLPAFDLFLLLDGTVEVMQPRDDQVLQTETPGQRGNYRNFLKSRRRYLILNTDRPLPIVAEEAYAAVIDALVQRTDAKLKNRF
jgi:hypothetical protein